MKHHALAATEFSTESAECRPTPGRKATISDHAAAKARLRVADLARFSSLAGERC